MVPASLLALQGLFFALAAASAHAAPVKNTSWWGDEFCHAPTQPACTKCWERAAGAPCSPGTPCPWGRREYTGNCSKCVVQPSVECGNCFPEVRPWYNGGETGAGAKPPPALKQCSPCLIRTIEDYRSVFNHSIGDADPKTGKCTCPPVTPTTPTGDCSSGLPGVLSCDCWCGYRADLRLNCGLDPDKLPGPCAFDKMFNESQGVPFMGQCDASGYYKLVACGPKAPPKLPPKGPALTDGARARTGERRQLPSADTRFPALGGGAAAPAAPAAAAAAAAAGFCWCVDPTYGIENGTSATPSMDASKPECQNTIQCNLLNKDFCLTIGAQFCEWAKIIPPGCNATACTGHYCAPIMLK